MSTTPPAVVDDEEEKEEDVDNTILEPSGLISINIDQAFSSNFKMPCQRIIIQNQENIFHLVRDIDPDYKIIYELKKLNVVNNQWDLIKDVHQSCASIFPLLFKQHGRKQLSCIIITKNNNNKQQHIQQLYIYHKYWIAMDEKKEPHACNKKFIKISLPNCCFKQEHLFIRINVQNNQIKSINSLNFDALLYQLKHLKHFDINKSTISITNVINHNSLCHFFVSILHDDFGSEVVFHVTHNPEEVDTKDKFKILDMRIKKNASIKQTFISNKSILCCIETPIINNHPTSPSPTSIILANASKDTKYYIKYHQCIYNKKKESVNWITSNVITQSYLSSSPKHQIHFDCCVLIKGRYCIIIHQQQFYLLNLKNLTLITIPYELLSTHSSTIKQVSSHLWKGQSSFQAILISDPAKDNITVCGFMRDIWKKQQIYSDFSFPPRYLLNLIYQWYCNEEIYLLENIIYQNVSLMSPFIINDGDDKFYVHTWKFNVDILFSFNDIN